MKDYASRADRLKPSRRRGPDASAPSTTDGRKAADQLPNKKTAWGATIVVVLGAALAGTVGRELGNEFGAATSQKTNAQRIDKSLSQAATAINGHGPRIVDSATRFDRASAGPGRRFRYDYTILGAEGRAMNQDRLHTNMASVIRSGYCGGESMQVWRTNGVRVLYRYADESGRTIGQISMRPSDC